MNESSTAYNAGVISALEDELIQPWEKERFGKLPQWVRLLINGLIKRIANNRAEIARLQTEQIAKASATALNKIARLRAALGTIADIGEGSTTANSLPNIAKIAREALIGNGQLPTGDKK